MRRAFRWAGLVCLVAAIAAAGAGWWMRGQLRASLALLDGRHTLPGLTAPVTVARDALGIPAVIGTTREDVARATGFLHAQDRFFQMDLSRRRAAGELAALVGARAVVLDQVTRLHRFRPQAIRVVAALPPDDRRVLEAYVGGVNAGLDALHAPPFEYLLLRQTPRPWRPEDTILVAMAMFLTLQDPEGEYESMLGTLYDVLPRPVADLLAPRGTEWDTPIDGDAFAVPPVPPAAAYDLRSRRRGRRPITLPGPIEVTDGGLGDRAAGDTALGSNNWAVASSETASGRPLVANDMHLTVRVPNTWYRASLEWGAGDARRRLAGVTLPGVPALVAGSNGDVAWGFTNTYADWSDVVLLEVDPADAGRYRIPDGWRRFDAFDETIEVAGAAPVRTRVRWTIWGPVLPPDHRGRLRALRWVAHDVGSVDWTVTPLESARSLDEVFAQANGAGVPGTNLIAADRAGHIGWTVYGAIPRRRGLDGRLPTTWADGTRGWDGYLTDSEYPRVVDPSGGRLWSANNRVVGGSALARLGDGGYEIGSRARAIRDRLAAVSRATVDDMLRIQLDTRAGFLERWRDLVLRVLGADATRGQPGRARLRETIEREWDGEVSPDAAGYGLVRMFREEVSDRVIGFVLAECYDADPAFNYRRERRREGAIWSLVQARPVHLLDPRFASWDDLLLAAADAVVSRLGGAEGVSRSRWSDYNRTAYRHPLSSALPFAARWLDMPPARLPGDLYTPRVHWGSAAASVRMVVSPGDEAHGVMQMPTGQSGHPLSPFYANSHPAWVAGTPTPFLPGAPAHTLRLEP